jgi:ribose 5-phosphate isomerase A
MADRDELKRAAAERAVEFVESGMVLGLGTGSTAAFFVEALAPRVGQGLSVIAIPTSERTAAQAHRLGIPLASFAEHRQIDLAVDGADEVQRTSLDLIKGRGGALLREKIVAASARRMIVIADASKLVERLGRFPLPVEVTPFGCATTAQRIRNASGALGYNDVTTRLRDAFVTDSGNVIYDCSFGAIRDPRLLAVALDVIPGVVDHGLFLNLASTLVIAGPEGVEVIEKK